MIRILSESHTYLLNKILDKVSNLIDSQQQQYNAPCTQTITSSIPNHRLEPNLSNYQTIIDSQNEYHSKMKQFIESLINEKFDSFKQIITSSMIDYNKMENIFKENKCGNRIFNNKNITRVNNPLEWSFSSANQSHNVSINNFRPDLFQLWHSFESNTWTALDNISHQVKTNSNKLDEINGHLVDSESAIRNTLTNNIHRSALTETIQQETYNSDVIDNIHRELCDLKQCFSSLSETQMEKEVINIISNNDTDFTSPSPAENNDNQTNKPNRELYVTKFKTNITSSHIGQYMDSMGVSIDHNTRITPLINPNRDLNMLSFISFKIDTTEDIAKIITSDNFWPKGCCIKNFIHKKSRGPTIIDQNFLIPQIKTTII